jgi:ribonuclease P protein component
VATSFRPHEHVRRRADFEVAYSAGAKVSSRFMTVFWRPNGGSYARLGIAATRKIGSAVIRNRAKRLARELFRAHKPDAAVDIVVVPRREFVEAPFPSLERDFEALLDRAARSRPPSEAARAQRGSARRARGNSRV